MLTRDDLKDLDPYVGQAVRDQPILAIDRVRFAGEPVAAVAQRAIAAVSSRATSA